MAQARGGINQNLRHIFRQQRILPRVKLLQVFRLDVIHQQIAGAFRLAMFDVADDVIALGKLRQHLAAAHETPPGREIETKLVLEFAQGEWLAAPVGHQPDFRHAAGVELFTQVKTPEFFLACRFIGCGCSRHLDNQFLTHAGNGGEQNFFPNCLPASAKKNKLSP